MNIAEYNYLVDLHIHFDGAMSLASARNLAALQGIDIPRDDEELKKLLMVPSTCRDLNEFLQCFDFPLSLMQTEIGLRNAAKNLGLELIEQGIGYAEIRFAPQLHCSKGLTQEKITEVVIDGFKESGLLFNLILCCMRGTDNKEANLETVRVAKEYLGKGVVLLDLAGAEALFPVNDFAYVFEYAQKLGVPYTIHAGEADGPQSVKNALSFDPVRIGHGVRSTEDDDLVAHLAELKIPLEMCPTSNLMTCIYKDISEYPLRKLLNAGVIVTINTDDPGVEGGIDLRHEYRILIDTFGLSDEEVRTLIQNSIESSMASEEIKSLLKEKLKLW